jgi:class 3 adenylate cyclase
MFDAIGGQGGVVNQMIGDGLMAIFGAPLPLPGDAGGARAAVRAAQDMQEMVSCSTPSAGRGPGCPSPSASASPPAT